MLALGFVLGLSVLSGAHLPLCTKLAAELEARGVSDLVWMIGGNIPSKDHEALRAVGITGVFQTGTAFEEIVAFVRESVVERRTA